VAIGTPTTLGTSAVDGAVAPLTTTAAVPSGALIVLCIGWGSGSAVTLSSVSGGGLTWNIDKQQAYSGAIPWGFAVVSAQAPSGLSSGTTITPTMSGSIFGQLTAGSYCTGLATSSAVDVTAGQGQTQDAWDTGSATTTVANTLVIGGSFRNGNNTNTPSGGATELHDFKLVAEDWAQCTEYKVLSATGSTSLAGTWTTAAGTPDMVSAFVAYKAASGATTVTGSASLTTTVGITTTGFKSTSGSSASTITVGIVSAGGRQVSGSAAQTVTAGIVSSGTRKTFGSSAQSITAGIVSSATRTAFGSSASTITVGITSTAGSATITGSSSLSLTAGITTSGSITHVIFGASSLTITFGATSSGGKTTAASASLGLNVNIVTVGVRGKAITLTAFNDGSLTFNPKNPGTLP